MKINIKAGLRVLLRPGDQALTPNSTEFLFCYDKVLNIHVSQEWTEVCEYFAMQIYQDIYGSKQTIVISLL